MESVVSPLIATIDDILQKDDSKGLYLNINGSADGVVTKPTDTSLGVGYDNITLGLSGNNLAGKYTADAPLSISAGKMSLAVDGDKLKVDSDGVLQRNINEIAAEKGVTATKSGDTVTLSAAIDSDTIKIDSNSKLATTSSYDTLNNSVLIYYNPNKNIFTTTKTDGYEIL